MHNITITFYPSFAFKIMHRVTLLTRFCKLLTTVAIRLGGGVTCLKCLKMPLPLVVWRGTRSVGSQCRSCAVRLRHEDSDDISHSVNVDHCVRSGCGLNARSCLLGRRQSHSPRGSQWQRHTDGSDARSVHGEQCYRHRLWLDGEVCCWSRSIVIVIICTPF